MQQQGCQQSRSPKVASGHQGLLRGMKNLLECLKLGGLKIQNKGRLIELYPLCTSFLQFSNHFPVACITIIYEMRLTRILPSEIYLNYTNKFLA
jgi:hypothetical protein